MRLTDRKAQKVDLMDLRDDAMNLRPLIGKAAILFLFSTLAVLQGAGANSPSPHCGDRFTKDEKYWDYDAEAAYAFGLEIQKVVRKRDLVALFSLVDDELQSGPRRKYVENKSFDDIFPEVWRQGILKSKPDCAPVGWRGFMLGAGRIWYRSDPFRVTVINGAREERFPPVPTGWKIDGRFLSPECFAREWPSSDNFKTFGEFAGQFGIKIGKFGTPTFIDFRNNPGRFFNDTFFPFDPILRGRTLISPWRNMRDCIARLDYLSFETSTVRYTPDEDGQEYVEYELLAEISTTQCQALAPNLRGRCIESYLVEIFEPGGSMSFVWHNIYGLFELRNDERMIFPLKNFETLNSARNFIDEL